MPTDLPPIPPAVVEFAQKNHIVNVQRNIFWTDKNPYNGYTVFNATAENNEEDYYFILLKDKNIRFSTEEEANEICDVYL